MKLDPEIWTTPCSVPRPWSMHTKSFQSRRRGSLRSPSSFWVIFIPFRRRWNSQTFSERKFGGCLKPSLPSVSLTCSSAATLAFQASMWYMALESSMSLLTFKVPLRKQGRSDNYFWMLKSSWRLYGQFAQFPSSTKEEENRKVLETFKNIQQDWSPPISFCFVPFPWLVKSLSSLALSTIAFFQNSFFIA